MRLGVTRDSCGWSAVRLGRRAAFRARPQSGEPLPTGTTTSAVTTGGSLAKMFSPPPAPYPFWAAVALPSCCEDGALPGDEAGSPAVWPQLCLTLCLVQPDAKHEREAWEIPYMVAGVGTIAILAIGLTYKPKTSIKVCWNPTRWGGSDA